MLFILESMCVIVTSRRSYHVKDKVHQVCDIVDGGIRMLEWFRCKKNSVLIGVFFCLILGICEIEI